MVRGTHLSPAVVGDAADEVRRHRDLGAFLGDHAACGLVVVGCDILLTLIVGDVLVLVHKKEELAVCACLQGANALRRNRHVDGFSTGCGWNRKRMCWGQRCGSGLEEVRSCLLIRSEELEEQGIRLLSTSESNNSQGQKVVRFSALDARGKERNKKPQ